MTRVFPPLAPGCVHPESWPARVDIPVFNALAVESVVCPHCTVTRLVHTESDLFKVGVFIKLPPDGNPHQ